MRSLIVRARGNALLMTLVALAVLMMIVVAAIQFTGTSREASVRKARGDELQACATVARKMLISKLRTFGVNTTNLQLNTVIPDSMTAGKEQQVLTGHYDSTVPEAVIVKLDAKVMGAARNQLRDMSNTLAGSTLGGDYYRVVVMCKQPSSNAQTEVEFTFRHGL